MMLGSSTLYLRRSASTHSFSIVMSRGDWLQSTDVFLLDTLVTSYVSSDADQHGHIRNLRGLHACIAQSLDRCVINDKIVGVQDLVNKVHGSSYTWNQEGEEFERMLLVWFPPPPNLVQGIGKATFTGCVKRYVQCLGSRHVHVSFT